MLKRLAIFCTNEFMAKYIIRNILLEETEYAVCCLCLSKKESSLQRVIKAFKKSGLKYTLFQIVNQWAHLACLQDYDIIKIAKERNIHVFLVEDINSAAMIKRLEKLDIDLIVSIQFDQIIKKDVFFTAKYGAINFHKALLPKYRGMAPIFWALLNKESNVGITVHYMDSGIDMAPILVQTAIHVEADDTLFSLYEKCASVAPAAIKQAIKLTDSSRSWAIPQNDEQASYFGVPTRAVVRQFLQNGGRFIKVKDLINIGKNLNYKSDDQ
jgi:folate-dependent phosphoribosylglycinamide formyltransferase PurN